jgi:ribonuclease Z
MPTLHLLGTGAALADARRTTTMLAFSAPGSVLVVDCGGDVVQRLLVHGLDLDEIEALILTHEHPDHVSGFPLFMEKIWLAGRRRPIPVIGPDAALSQARRTFESFETGGWDGMPEIEWREIPLERETELLRTAQWRISASPGDHSVPVVALRVESGRGTTVTYSADTGPSETVADLARNVEILVHEASGEFPGHSTMRDAAATAARAEAKRLVLVHLPPDPSEAELTEARAVFRATELGEDGARYDF